MNLNTQVVDKVAIIISSLCVVHCLLIPILIVLAPSVITVGLTSESFHMWMIIAVIPSSIYALALGCKKHAKASVFIMGALGLSCLILAFMLGGSILGEIGEKAFTLIGALLIVLAHIKNFKLCNQVDDCKCDSTQKS